jgi:pimeloyl-ACP methyl ester carboxylesterase
MEIRSEIKRQENLGIIQGEITATASQDGPVMVRQYVQNEAGVFILKSQQYAKKGVYQFNSEPGGYFISAFVDVNKDGENDPNAPEPFNYHSNRGEPAEISVKPGETVIVNLTISGILPSLPDSIQIEEDLIPYLKNIGKVTNLDDYRFDRKNYSTGLLMPLLFLKQAEGGLFFLQEYDPGKVPVLFVHGARGGPRDFEKMIENLDKQHFQPWVFYYPSGVSLNILSGALVKTINDLKIQKGIKQLCIVAHSMGGLITRSFVKKYLEQFPEDAKTIRLVMTINSPIGGMASAAKGVKNSPIVIQSWRDIASGSEFVKDINEWRWPKGIPYYLVYSSKTGNDGDGTVALDSQLNLMHKNELKLQLEATQKYCFNSTHVGILDHDAFLVQFNKIMADSLEEENGV